MIELFQLRALTTSSQQLTDINIRLQILNVVFKTFLSKQLQ